MHPEQSVVSAALHRADLLREARSVREGRVLRPSRRSARALLRRVMGE